ncbi:MAG: EutN/CcmL family microcompartment protein [Planctomycetes bacterium]|nr:EutN/CcmL family microcompartment protein [Planctomycetota bacterium]
MFIARVRGNVVTTQKVPKMTGKKLLVVDPLRVNEKTRALEPTGRSVIAVDFLDAGVDELVLITQGSSARMTDATSDSPVDCVIIGIIDSVSLSEATIYGKSGK